MSVTNKEKNFISAVVYLHNDGAQAVRFFKALNAVLDQHFEQYELVAVDDACTDDTIPTLRGWAKAPLTVSYPHSPDAISFCSSYQICAGRSLFDSEEASSRHPPLLLGRFFLFSFHQILCLRKTVLANYLKLFSSYFLQRFSPTPSFLKTKKG
mgnify:CR=1 FL=1